jgi:hypothetical protein
MDMLKDRTEAAIGSRAAESLSVNLARFAAVSLSSQFTKEPRNWNSWSTISSQKTT